MNRHRPLLQTPVPLPVLLFLFLLPVLSSATTLRRSPHPPAISEAHTVAHHVHCNLASDCPLPGSRCVDYTSLQEGRSSVGGLCSSLSPSACTCYGPAAPCSSPRDCGPGTRCIMAFPDHELYCLPCAAVCTPAYTVRRAIHLRPAQRAIGALCIDVDPDTCEKASESPSAYSAVPRELLPMQSYQPEVSPNPPHKTPCSSHLEYPAPSVSASVSASESPEILEIPDPFSAPPTPYDSPEITDPYKTPCASHREVPSMSAYSSPEIPDPFTASPLPSESPDIIDSYKTPSASHTEIPSMYSSTSPEIPGIPDPFTSSPLRSESPEMKDPYGTPCVSCTHGSDPFSSTSISPEVSDPFTQTPIQSVTSTPSPSLYSAETSMSPDVPDPYRTLCASQSHPDVDNEPSPSPAVTDPFGPSRTPWPTYTPIPSYVLGSPSSTAGVNDRDLNLTPSNSLTPADGGIPLPSTPTAIPDFPYGEESPPMSPEGDFETVCIHAEALKDWDMKDLVYRTHRRASVLCDRDNNCATPGHIVIYKGTPMMMKSYCKAVEKGCAKTVKFVNSPRMKRTRRVRSYSSHLEYTSLSARYESGIEEAAMKMIMMVYG